MALHTSGRFHSRRFQPRNPELWVQKQSSEFNLQLAPVSTETRRIVLLLATTAPSGARSSAAVSTRRDESGSHLSSTRFSTG
jgi:hypothetical protein